MRLIAPRLPDSGRRRVRQRLLPLVLVGSLTLPGLDLAGETGEEFWPEIDVWIRC